MLLSIFLLEITYAPLIPTYLSPYLTHGLNDPEALTYQHQRDARLESRQSGDVMMGLKLEGHLI